MSSVIENVHEINFKLLSEADRLCRAHGLKYYLSSGTLLGAVRHKGFIPWDDDIDIEMKRRDYELFKQICKSELDDRFEFEEPPARKQYFTDFIPGILYKNSKRHDGRRGEDFSEKLKLDIFILDDTYNSDLRAKLHMLKLVFYYGLAMGHRRGIDPQKHKGAYKAAIGILSKIGKGMPLKKIIDKYDKCSSKYSGNTGYLLPGNFPPPEMLGFYHLPCEWYEDTEDVTINDKQFMAPKGWETILKSLYGDYMALPPESERTLQHVDVDVFKVWD
ncbi:MAG: LicD family protein [Christensenella sp.]